MRTLVDIPVAKIKALDELAARRDRSRAALIRDAVDDYLAKIGATSGDDAFGLWNEVDGLDYEQKLRREW